MEKEFITLKLDEKEFDILKKALAKDIVELKFKKETETEEEIIKRQNEILKKQKLLYAMTFLER